MVATLVYFKYGRGMSIWLACRYNPINRQLEHSNSRSVGALN
jgi:hypothetical protein